LTEVPRPPTHLKAATKRWWCDVVEEYDLADHHLRLLTLAGEAWDRCTQAREVLKTEGLTYLDRFEAPKAHPCVAIERDSRIAFARLIRELDLDGEAAPDPRQPRRR
jgi:P27 family predicted phage terminase small subunit